MSNSKRNTINNDNDNTMANSVTKDDYTINTIT